MVFAYSPILGVSYGQSRSRFVSPGLHSAWHAALESGVHEPHRQMLCNDRCDSHVSPLPLPTTRLFNAVRRRAMLARGVAVGLRPEVTVGPQVLIGRSVRWRLEPGARVVLADGCELDDGVTVAVSRGATITFGEGAFVGHHATIAARSSIVVHDRAFIAELVSIRDHDHDPALPPSSGQNVVAPVVIGADSWLGAKCTVTRGITIGENAVVGANAVVTHDVPAKTTVVGVPATALDRVRP